MFVRNFSLLIELRFAHVVRGREIFFTVCETFVLFAFAEFVRDGGGKSCGVSGVVGDNNFINIRLCHFSVAPSAHHRFFPPARKKGKEEEEEPPFRNVRDSRLKRAIDKPVIGRRKLERARAHQRKLFRKLF